MNKKPLIAYFSHDGEAYVSGNIVKLEIGNTKAAAQMIEKLTNGELLRIETEKPYPHDYMQTVEIAKEELQKNARPKLKNAAPDLDDIDVVILAYPNWWGTMPMAVFHFLESYDFSGKKILPLCTHEGSKMGHSETDIKRLCPNTEVEKGLAITGGSVNKAGSQIEKWLKSCGII